MRKARLAVVASALLLAAGGCDRGTPAPAPSAHGNDAPRPSALPPGPARSPNAEVDDLVRENLDAELVEHPIAATWMGVHAWDDRIDDVRPEAQAREAIRLRALLDRLRAVDEKHLDASHAFDRLLLEHHPLFLGGELAATVATRSSHFHCEFVNQPCTKRRRQTIQGNASH